MSQIINSGQGPSKIPAELVCSAARQLKKQDKLF